jgi:RNA-directed DNA polymerase
MDNIRDIINKNKSCRQETLIRLLNPKITGWANYYRFGASSSTFANVDYHIWWALWRWAKRRHPKKGKRWIMARYFHQHKGRSNNFLVKLDKRGKVDIFPLKLAFKTKIIRHTKIDSKANPFDTKWIDYFEERETYKMKLSLKGRSSLLYMWKKQGKLCPICNKPIDSETQWNVREKNAVNGKIKLLVHDACYKVNR